MEVSSREQFDRQASLYAGSAVHRHGASLPVLIEFARVLPGERALDVATGTGNTARSLSEAGAEVVGLDVSLGMLAQAKSQDGPARFVRGSAERIPFADASFDLVTARHAPHHFRDVPAFLREVRRVLRPGGRFVMADGVSPSAEAQPWFDLWQRLRDPSHGTNRTVEEWRDLASEFVWTRDALVPYRLEFEWWTRQSGCSPERVERLVGHARTASPRIREEVGLEFEGDRPLAFHEPMLVARLDRA